MAAEQAEQDVIEIRPELLDLPESYGRDTCRPASRGKNARSLAFLKKGAKKKRTRKQFNESMASVADPNAPKEAPIV